MNITDYNKIPTFDEALAIVEKEKGFSHSMQEIHGKEVHSFKYNISYQGMWDDLSDGKINMRGLTFVDGNLVALPCPKFFNLGENEHTRSMEIADMQFATEKVDGSLISFFNVGDELEIKTMKSVYSDTAAEAREYLKERDDVVSFAKMCLNFKLSPMFEYVSDTDAGKIVIDYGKKDFVFLGARDLNTGRLYMDLHNFPILIPDSVKPARVFLSPEGVEVYNEQEGVEGVVLTLKSGLMVKVKTGWYCRLHKVLDTFNTKNILESIVNDNIDDVKASLAQNGLDDHLRVIGNVERTFDMYYDRLLKKAKGKCQDCKLTNMTKKDIAMTLMKEDRVLASLVFALYDGKDITESIKKNIKEKLKDKELNSFCPF